MAKLKRMTKVGVAWAPQPSGFIIPPAPKLTSLESQSAVWAWIASVEHFYADLHIPEAQKLVWAVSNLEGDAASAWDAFAYLRQRESISFKEIGKELLKKAYQKYSVYSLWGQWTALRQGPTESSQKYYDQVRDLASQEEMPSKWAVAALIRGLREPLRSHFYDQFEEGEDRSISLDDAACRFMQYEATQSYLQRSGGFVSSASGKRSAEESLSLAKKKIVSSTLCCWICGSMQHAFGDCHRKKETGCASCGGSCENVRKCSKNWFYLN